ncbi:MAG: glycosyltransferase family 4 protein [Thermodesulfobacteriota bacterium]
MPDSIFYVYFHDKSFVPFHVRELVAELGRRGRKVHVFTAVNPSLGREVFSSPNVTLHNLPAVSVRFFSEMLFLCVLFPCLVLSALRERPEVFYTRNGASSMAACLAARLLRRPCFVEVNDIWQDKLLFSRPPWAKLLWLRLYHFINYRLGTMLLPVTWEIADFCAESYGVPASRLAVVPNGVDAEHFRPLDKAAARRRWGVPEDARVVLSLGSLFSWAGLETLVQAAPAILAAHSETVFVIGSGEEPYLSQIKALAREAGLSQSFRFPGYILKKDAPAFIAQADLCAAPFIFRQVRSGVSSLRVYAYMACGKPVAGSDIPGLGDVLEKRGAGVSVPMEDAPALARAVIGLLDDPEKAEDMGRKARIYVMEQHSWGAIADRLLRLFHDAQGGKRP